MTVAKTILLPLPLVLLVGCAAQLQWANTSQTVVEKELQEQKKETKPPTITYRPGS